MAVARGAVIAVIDAAGRLGIDAAAPPSEIVVVDTAAGPCGVAVERTQSVTGSVAVTLPPPRAAAAAYVTGLALVEGEWVAVLDPDRFCRMVEPAAP